MHYSRIEAATVPSLFDVHNNFGGYGKYSGCHDERPRQAVDAEIFAYAEWLAFQGGQMTRKERAIVRRDHVRAALDRSADGLDMMTERALRAENALRAVEQRQDRAGAPYRVNIGAVSFRAAA